MPLEKLSIKKRKIKYTLILLFVLFFLRGVLLADLSLAYSNFKVPAKFEAKVVSVNPLVIKILTGPFRQRLLKLKSKTVFNKGDVLICVVDKTGKVQCFKYGGEPR
ncbi:hypothetical protein [Desulfurobacterium sp.]